MADLKCQVCGKDMLGVRRDKKFCSSSCSNKAHNSRENVSRIKECEKCGKEFEVEGTGYSRRYCFDCVPKNECTNGAQVRQMVKKWALEYKGDCCCLCGYNKCTEALEFHHMNQEEKEFHLSDRNLVMDWKLIRLELDKCILVCSNCHREIHSGHTNIK